jgi:hypothetical protein
MLLHLTRAGPRLAEVVARLGVVGLEAHRFGELREDLVVLPGLRQRH